MTGLAPDAEPGTPPRAQYDPLRMSLRAREQAVELREAVVALTKMMAALGKGA